MCILRDLLDRVQVYLIKGMTKVIHANVIPCSTYYNFTTAKDQPICNHRIRMPQNTRITPRSTDGCSGTGSILMYNLTFKKSTCHSLGDAEST